MHTTIKTYTLQGWGMHTLEIPRNAEVLGAQYHSEGVAIVVREDELAPPEDRHFIVVHEGEEISGSPRYLGSPRVDTHVLEQLPGGVANV